jgi:hypothetical protein
VPSTGSPISYKLEKSVTAKPVWTPADNISGTSQSVASEDTTILYRYRY